MNTSKSNVRIKEHTRQFIDHLVEQLRPCYEHIEYHSNKFVGNKTHYIKIPKHGIVFVIDARYPHREHISELRGFSHPFGYLEHKAETEGLDEAIFLLLQDHELFSIPQKELSGFSKEELSSVRFLTHEERYLMGKNPHQTVQYFNNETITSKIYDRLMPKWAGKVIEIGHEEHSGDPIEMKLPDNPYKEYYTLVDEKNIPGPYLLNNGLLITANLLPEHAQRHPYKELVD